MASPQVMVPEGAELIDPPVEMFSGLGWWQITCNYMPNTVPAHDIRNHLSGKNCWCRPVDEGDVIVHNAADGRERYQQGDAKAH